LNDTPVGNDPAYENDAAIPPPTVGENVSEDATDENSELAYDSVSGDIQLGKVNVTIAECGVTFWLLWVRPSQSARIA
jgi:hypothetical protein